MLRSRVKPTLPEERTYFPFLEKATEQTGALSWAWRKVATHLLETPSQILMLPSVEPLTKFLPVLFHLRLVISPVWWWELTELTKHWAVLTSYILMTGLVVPVTTKVRSYSQDQLSDRRGLT